MTKIRNVFSPSKIGGYAGPVGCGRSSRKGLHSFSSASPPRVWISNRIIAAVLAAIIVTTAVVFSACDDAANGTTGNGPTDTFDENGFNTKTGDHKETGTPYNPEGFDKNGYNEKGFDKDGYNRQGFDNEGYGRDGFNASGWNRDEINKNTRTKYDSQGYDINGWNAQGWNRQNTNKETGNQYDKDGYNRNGLDSDGYDRQGLKGGFDKDGIYAATGNPYNPQGNKADGTKWYDEQGYDFEGFNSAGWNSEKINKMTGTAYDNQGYDMDGWNALGWNRTGVNKTTGTLYDNDGYDVGGFNTAGWNRTGVNKTTGTLYDNQGYDMGGFNSAGWNRDGINKTTGTNLDSDGYNAAGNDKFGVNKSVQPVNSIGMDATKYINKVSDVTSSIKIMRNTINEVVGDIKSQFNTTPLSPTNSRFYDVVKAACNGMQSTASNVNGYLLIGNGLTNVSKIIAEMVHAYPAAEQSRFRLDMEAFRLRAYLGDAGRGPILDCSYGREINVNDPTGNPSRAELDEVYMQLASVGGPNAANFEQYINNTLVPSLSEALQISPVLVKSLLNLITTFEWAYASVDDIRALGFTPIMSGAPTIQPFSIRNRETVNGELEHQFQQIQQQ